LTDRFLADACAVIVFLAGAPMSAQLQKLMSEGDVVVSSITAWEITRKASLGKLPANWGAAGLSGLLQGQGFTSLPLDWTDAECANALPPIHKDPMDRILIAQALRHDMAVLTSDAVFTQYGVRTVW
jgi:PIN domain nuclease of toxin-antitoxin system